MEELETRKIISTAVCAMTLNHVDQKKGKITKAVVLLDSKYKFLLKLHPWLLYPPSLTVRVGRPPKGEIQYQLHHLVFKEMYPEKDFFVTYNVLNVDTGRRESKVLRADGSLKSLVVGFHNGNIYDIRSANLKANNTPIRRT